MKFTIKEIAVLALVCLSIVLNSGCKKIEEVNTEAVKSIHKHKLLYFKDYRTELCFAFFGSLPGDGSYAMLANVPCDVVSDYLLTGTELEGPE